MNTPHALDVELFGHWICPYSTRVSFSLAEREITHRLTNVPPTAARPRGFTVPAAFLTNSPKGEIPMLRIGNEYLADSIPILRWLEDRITQNPMLPVVGSERSVVLDRAARIDAALYPAMIGIYYGVEDASIHRASHQLDAVLSEIAEWLEPTGWLAGGAISMAESILAPFYVRLEGLRHLGFDHDLDPLIEAHRLRLEERPSFDAVRWNQQQTEEFVGRFEAYRSHRKHLAANESAS
jgi:glutathione S-transferase